MTIEPPRLRVSPTTREILQRQAAEAERNRAPKPPAADAAAAKPARPARRALLAPRLHRQKHCGSRAGQPHAATAISRRNRAGRDRWPTDQVRQGRHVRHRRRRRADPRGRRLHGARRPNTDRLAALPRRRPAAGSRHGSAVRRLHHAGAQGARRPRPGRLAGRPLRRAGRPVEASHLLRPAARRHGRAVHVCHVSR